MHDNLSRVLKQDERALIIRAVCQVIIFVRFLSLLQTRNNDAAWALAGFVISCSPQYAKVPKHVMLPQIACLIPVNPNRPLFS